MPTLPPDVIGDILGAASMPVGFTRVAFGEGTVGSLDIELFEAWLEGEHVAVQRLGGCEDVVAAVGGFGRCPNVTARALGIVDRDARCHQEIEPRPSGFTTSRRCSKPA